MFHKILIANRGEIALRVIRACRELNIRTVAVYSLADENSLHVRYADEAICIGPGPSIESYLHIPNIISAAVLSESDGIHPGYGYLSERASFAEICESHGITFIGPAHEQIELMGNKSKAKRAMVRAGVPVIPGSDGPVETEAELVKVVEEIGYPVMLKAAAGGGGRGMRLVTAKEDLIKSYQITKREAQAAFGNGDIYVERFVDNPRHIEIQILADHYGNVVHFGERECSLQRRHQKIMEEAPSPVVDSTLRKIMGEKAVQAARAVQYKNAGTIEFLLDNEGMFYFMEMNTRIQVEHPVTEIVYNVDLIKEQIRIAEGNELGYEQKDILPQRHAIECRINAEDPSKNFRPSPGLITRFHAPGGPGVRWDSHVYQGYTIPPYYDSMFGKLITFGNDRDEALGRMAGALRELVVEGIETNISFQQMLVSHEKVLQGDFSTKFVERLLK